MCENVSESQKLLQPASKATMGGAYREKNPLLSAEKKRKKNFRDLDWLFGVKNILKSLELYAIDRNVEFKTMNIFHITSKGIILCVRLHMVWH